MKALHTLFTCLTVLFVTSNAFAVDMEQLYKDRKFKSFFVFEESMKEDLSIELPITQGQFKPVGFEDESHALSVKLGLMSHAKHTIDLAYYIFKRDIVGYSILYEACKAVKRGVDVRILLDSFGSIHYSHGELKALKQCARKAGYLVDEDGNKTKRKARVQSVIFNPLFHPWGRARGLVRRIWNYSVALVFPQYRVASIHKWANRRMHDKILIVDGDFPGKAVAMMGGRNISVNYYGIDKKGQTVGDSYKDMEVLIKDVPAGTIADEDQFGAIISNHFDHLFKHLGNKKLRQWVPLFNRKYKKKMEENYAKLVANPEVGASLRTYYEYMSTGFRTAMGRWTHELQNLHSRKTSSKWNEHENKNPNSIEAKLREAIGKSLKKITIVSPYLFFRKVTTTSVKESERVNEYAQLQEWLGRRRRTHD